jgi:hypothetical protein
MMSVVVLNYSIVVAIVAVVAFVVVVVVVVVVVQYRCRLPGDKVTLFQASGVYGHAGMRRMTELFVLSWRACVRQERTDGCIIWSQRGMNGRADICLHGAYVRILRYRKCRKSGDK